MSKPFTLDTSEKVASLSHSASDATAEHLTLIEPRSGWKALNFRELWQSRELIYFLTWRDVKVRYKQSLLGVAWAVIQPVMYMVVFTIVFGRMAQVPSDGIPYPLFSFAALLPWTFFTTAVSQAGNSVVASESLITKVYFPRLAVPLASVCAAIFDFFISFIVLVGLIIYYNSSASGSAVAPVQLSWNLWLVPLLLGLIACVAMGVGTLLAALNVAYRDFKYTIPFLMQLWLFATPTIYMGSSHEAPAAQSRTASKYDTQPVATSSELSLQEGDSDAKNEGAVSDRVQGLLNLNPMTPLIGSFRAAVLGKPISWGSLMYATCAAVLSLLIGCLYFHRVEYAFADII